MGLIFLISPSSGVSPSFDPGSGHNYDTFGGFFDQFGQYVDPMGGVMDQYDEYVPDSYSPDCNIYYDSKGQFYGVSVHSGELKEGDWHFGNIDYT